MLFRCELCPLRWRLSTLIVFTRFSEQQGTFLSSYTVTNRSFIHFPSYLWPFFPPRPNRFPSHRRFYSPGWSSAARRLNGGTHQYDPLAHISHSGAGFSHDLTASACRSAQRRKPAWATFTAETTSQRGDAADVGVTQQKSMTFTSSQRESRVCCSTVNRAWIKTRQHQPPGVSLKRSHTVNPNLH